MSRKSILRKGVSHWAANPCERSEFWIRQLFVRVRKRLQTISQTVFIVAKSFSQIVASVCKTVVSVCKTVVNVCETVVSLCKRLYDVSLKFFLICQCHRPRDHSSSMKSTHWDQLSPKFFLIRQVCRIGSIDSPGTLPGVGKRSQTFTYGGNGLANSC